MRETGYERLSGLDASFLLIESPNVYTHAASTAIFRAGPLALPDGRIDIEAIEQAHRALIDRIPRYRQVVRFAPVTGHPIWVDDPHFDLSYHLHHTSLPRPGREEQLERLAARIVQQHLDRARPLWETWVVEGLEGERFALIAKVHHCMLDGLAGPFGMHPLLSQDPNERPPAGAAAPPARPAPGGWQLLREDLAARARLPLGALRALRELARRDSDPEGRTPARAREALAALVRSLRPSSETPLDRPVGPHRRIAWRRMDLRRLREIEERLEAPADEVVLAVAAGAFGHFLRARGVDPGRLEFRALVPKLGPRDEPERDAAVPGRLVSLPVGEPDPEQRLRRIAQQTASLEDSRQAPAAELLAGALGWLPAGLLALGVRAAGRALPFNTIVGPVPGPPEPLYLLGARLLELYPHLPLVDRVDVTVAVTSHGQGLFWGINADYDTVPDLDGFAAALDRAFDETCRAAGLPGAGGEARTAAAAPEAELHGSGARHRELTDDASRRHESLTVAMDALERALAAPASQRARPWSERVADQLARVRETIRAHVDGVEEADGLFDEIQVSAPRLAARVKALEQEHQGLVARASALADRLPAADDADFGALRREASVLLADLRAHRATEADLVYEAFWTELGGGD